MDKFYEVFKKGSIDGYKVTPLNSDDENRIQEFLLECEDYEILETGRGVEPGDARAMLTDLPPNKILADKYVFSVEQGGRMVAVLDIIQNYKAPGTWWIGLLLISPSMRGKGLGSLIVEYIFENLAENSVKEIQLAVLEENEAGRVFWKKMGFKHVETVYGRRHGLKVHNLLVMSRRVVRHRERQLVVAKP